MRILLLTLLCIGLASAYVLSAVTSEVSYAKQAYVVTDAEAPEVSAKAWGIFDTETGELIVAHNAREAYPIASLTKLMTAAVALEMPSIDATTTVSWRAVSTEGRAGRLAAGDILTLRELLFPLMLESSNDAAEAIAEHAGRDAFIAAMNARAAAIGMPSAHFADPSGLSPENVASVVDVKLLMEYLDREERFLLDVTRLPTYVGAEHTWRNINPAREHQGFRGGKHGYTEEANRTLAGVFAAPLAANTERTLTIVLLGSDNLPADLAALDELIRTAVRYE